ncbi:MAG: preprotein translocase subunit SecG [Deltaproteobacteria bacterium]|nr:preprotein translocase subunit SecG [Deltaproteobacteria bacterium]
MQLIILIVHVVVCLSLILIILVQQVGAAFGGSSQTVFGSAGATSFDCFWKCGRNLVYA